MIKNKLLCLKKKTYVLTTYHDTPLIAIIEPVKNTDKSWMRMSRIAIKMFLNCKNDRIKTPLTDAFRKKAWKDFMSHKPVSEVLDQNKKCLDNIMDLMIENARFKS